MALARDGDGARGVQPPIYEAAQQVSLIEAGWGMDASYPRVATVRPGGGVEVGASNGRGATLGRAEVHVPIFIPLSGAPWAFLELAGEGEWRHGSRVGAGLRLQSVFFLEPRSYEVLYLFGAVPVALEPFVAFTPERLPFYGRFGVLVAANDPLGGSDPAVTFRFQLGWKLPR